MIPRAPAEGDLVLQRYRLEKLVGKGGAGTVWVAVDERLNRPVAVKLLHPQPRVPQAAARLTREARTLAQLRHPGLVTLLDFGFTEENAPAMVMEYLEGVSLKALGDVHPFSVSEVAAVLDQALAAIEACHLQGIIHRDLKPANLLVARSPGNLCVKIIDFGIVALAADTGATALTVSGEVFGSLRFMPPEQWRQEDVGPHTDLYALGCVAYQLLLGEPFIRELSPVKVYSAHLEQVRPRPSVDRAGGPVPVGFLEVLECACQPEWRHRFADAPAMRAALGPFVGTVPTPPLPEPLAPRSVEQPISVAELLNARTSVANVGAMEGHTSLVESPIDPGIEPGLDLAAGRQPLGASAPGLVSVRRGFDPSATLVSDPPSEMEAAQAATLAEGRAVEGTVVAVAVVTPAPEPPALDLQTRLLAAVDARAADARNPSNPDLFGPRRVVSALGSALVGLPPGVPTQPLRSSGTDQRPAAHAARNPPWWVWLAVAALVGGLVGFAATRM